jgi:hypothetical protein
MAEALYIYTELFQLRGGNFSKRDGLITRKRLKEILEHRQPGSSLLLVRHTIAQQSTARIE